jgi:hypothetical protein
MSRLEHVVRVGAAIKKAAPTSTPAGLYPREELPDDVISTILKQVVEGTPVEELCSTVRERCLLLYGSGNCPADETFWSSVCQRMGLTPQAGFAPLGTWQGTFHAFCTQLGNLYEKTFHDAIRLCMQGHADLVPYEDRLWFLYDGGRIPDRPEVRAQEVRARQARWRQVAPLPIQLLEHHGVLEQYPEGLNDALRNNQQNIIDLLLAGRPSRGLQAMVQGIDEGERVGWEVVTQLLRAGVNPNSRVTTNQTLLQFAVTRRNPTSLFVVQQLLLFGADKNVKNDAGKTPVEVVTSNLFRQIRQRQEYFLRGNVTLQNDTTLSALMRAWRALDRRASHDFERATTQEQVAVALRAAE